MWYEHRGPLSTRNAGSRFEAAIELWNGPPKLARWPVLSAALRAVAALRHTDSTPSRYRGAVPVAPVGVTSSDGSTCTITAIPFEQDRRRYSDAEQREHMSVGSTTQCNFCNKPKQAAPLLRCSRCKAIWYCNKDCQRQDWRRHKPECKPGAAVDRAQPSVVQTTGLTQPKVTAAAPATGLTRDRKAELIAAAAADR